MINKRKITGVIGLIFISPLLLAVSRYSETNNEYSRIEVAVDNVKEDPEGEDTSLYDLTIKNTGKGYIRCIEYSEGGRRRTTFYMEDETSPITASPLLKAYSECKYENFRWYTDEEFPKGSFMIIITLISMLIMSISSKAKKNIYFLSNAIHQRMIMTMVITL